MSSHERMLSVIEAFYDAALDETLWPSALKDLADVTGSQAASFWVLDGSETPRLPTFVCINFDIAAIREYLEQTAPMDPTVQYLVAHPRQPIVHDGLVISERDKDKHPYYDWHERLIDTRFRMVGQARLMPSMQAGVALHRRRKAGRYEPKDLDKFAVLHRHLERALAIGARIGSLSAMEKFGTEWLDGNSSAIFLLDDRKQVLFMNRAARVLVESGSEGVNFSSAGVMLASRHHNDKLQSLIARALPRHGSREALTGGSMRSDRPSGKRPFGIHVSPITCEHPALTLFRPAVCVIFTDPEQQPMLPLERFQAEFGLTEAEARLAALVANGEDLRVAAEKLQITYGTARVRLSEIFQKTDTRRQAELVRLLLTTMVPH